MSNDLALNIKRATPSPCYWGFWRGMQDTGDGRTSIVDGSGQGRNLLLGAGATYSGVVGTTAGYAAILGTAAGTDRSIATAQVFQWDLFAGQSVLLAATINAAAPGATVQLFNARGASGNLQGLSVLLDSTGKPSVVVRDAPGTSFISVVPTEVFTDSTNRQIIIGIDGSAKRAFLWRDGAAVSNTGQTITATGGSTQCDDPARWGGNGDVTWTNGAQALLRDMHLMVMPYWPANIASIVAELVRNPHRPLPARMLPALASA